MTPTSTIAIVGGGLAGLSAALEAFDQANKHKTHATPPKIILLEKEKNIGGNSMKASSGINAVEPKNNDTMDDFYQDTIQAGHGQPELVRKLVQESPSALAWLTEAGVDLSVVSQCGGHSRARTHRCPPGPNGMPVPVGFKLVDTLKKRAQQLGIDMQTNARVTSLLLNNHNSNQSPSSYWTLTINGDTELKADSLVLTSGGFGGQIHASMENNIPTLLKEYAPQWVDRATTNGPWANGDGVRLGLALGAATIDMDQVQIHPTGFVDPSDPDAMTKFLAPEALRAYGGILLNAQGQRFVNELTTRDKLTQAILAQTHNDGNGGPVVIYLVLSEQAAKDFGASTLGFYAKKGLVQEIKRDDNQTANEDVTLTLARAMGLDDATTLTMTFKDYDGYTEKDPFGKTRFPSKMLTSPGYWLARITPCVHYTMGGLKINTDAQILSKDNETPIPGLFGAGEVTGGVHGSNRLAGNSLLECVVYGRTAGCQAYQHLVR
ncbi:FAD binding domain-containing protein [Absidia repens]|uniref:Fumarate reductase n=1 Tax=Absidia repens TaxID=90262 RepID=A0A1X2IXF9_9FUNG|nr:FAD binding domain-containing protein [Absidia repens]